MTQTKNATSSLADFKFDEDDDVFDFENIAVGKASPPKTISKVKKEEEEEDDDDDTNEKPTKIDEDDKKKGTKAATTTKKVEDTEEDDEEVFDDFSTGGKSDSKVKKEETGKKEESKSKDSTSKAKEEGESDTDDELDDDFYTNLALDLKENDVFQNIEIPKDKKLTQEEFFDLQEDEVEARVTEAFEAFAENLDEDGKAFIKFKQKGGSTRDFMTRYLTPDFDLDEFDEENKDHVAKTIDYYLRTVEKLDGEELEDRKEFIKTGGKEKDKAKSYFNKIDKTRKEQKEAVLKALDAKAAKEEKDTEDFNNELLSILDNVETVGSFKINKEDKKGMASYFTKPTVKVGKNSFIPQFQADLAKILRGKSDQDKKDLIALGKIVKNKFKIEDLAQVTETQITRKIKARIKNNSPRATTAGASSSKELADFFQDE